MPSRQLVVPAVALLAAVIALPAASARPAPPAGHVVFRLADGPLMRITARKGAKPENLSAKLDALSEGADRSVNVSSNGRWLVVDSERFGCDGDPCLALVRADLTSGVRLVPGEDRLRSDSFAAVADDGRSVVYTSSDGPHDVDLWLARRASTTAAKVTTTLLTGGAAAGAYNTFPSITGTRVLFNCGTGPEPPADRSDVCEVGLDGKGLRKVLREAARPRKGEPPSLHHADRLSDGGIVVESRWGGFDGIWKLKKGAKKPVLATPSRNAVAPCALPGGRFAYLDLARPGNRDGRHELSLADTKGRRTTLVAGKDILDAGIGCSR